MSEHPETPKSSEDIIPDIRLAEPCDLEAINAFYHQEYGAEYPGYLKTADLSDPDRVVLVGMVGSEIGGVAQTTTFRKKTEGDTEWSADNAFELKGLVVRHKDRHRHIGQKLLERRLEALVALGARIAYVEPICRGKECASARNVMNHQFSMTGILPAKYPDELVVANQPESVTMGIKVFKGELGWGSRGVYLPEEYSEILHTVVPETTKSGRIQLLTGPMPHVRHIAAEVAEGRHGSEFAEVPANWPEAFLAILDLREQGYLLAGVMPDIFTTATGEPYDTIVMYKPPRGVIMNFDAIHVVAELQPLHEFMREEYDVTREK